MIFNIYGHLQGRVGAGDEGGFLPAGPSTDHVVTAAVWGMGGQVGKQAWPRAGSAGTFRSLS